MKKHASTATAKFGLAALAGLSLLGAVTGCTTSSGNTEATSAGDDSTVSSPAASSSPAPSAVAPSAVASSPAAPSPAASGSTTASSGTVKDGRYSEVGRYDSPAGEGSITVTVTLAAGVITKVKVTPHDTDPSAQIYQSQFVGGIAAVVVGKKIDKIKVSRVAGSSLTSIGFNQAIGKIKTDATT